MVKRKNKVQLITALDVGSHAIRVAIGKIVETEKSRVNNLQIVGLVEVKSEGVRRGEVSSIEDLVSAISSAFEEAERMSGILIESVYMAISGPNIQFQENKGVVAVAKTDGEICEEDVERALQSANAVSRPLNYDILHVLPKSFTVDGQTGIKDPVGMTGNRLEVDTYIIQVSTSHHNNLSKAVHRTNVDIDDKVFSILAIADSVLNSRQKDLGACVVDIGASTTTMMVFEEGEITHTAVIPVGAGHITNDLAIALKSSIEVAEKVKIKYGHCIPKDVDGRERIDLSDFSDENEDNFSLKFISQVINARMEEILEKIDDELKKIGRSQLLPAGVVYTGGGAEISGLIKLSKELLALPSSLGYPMDISGLSDQAKDLSFVGAISLLKWGMNFQNLGINRTGLNIKGLDKMSKQIGSWFKSLVP